MPRGSDMLMWKGSWIGRCRKRWKWSRLSYRIMLNTLKWLLIKMKMRKRDWKTKTFKRRSRERTFKECKLHKWKKNPMSLLIWGANKVKPVAPQELWALLEAAKDHKEATWVLKNSGSTKACSKKSARRRNWLPLMQYQKRQNYPISEMNDIIVLYPKHWYIYRRCKMFLAYTYRN